MAWGWDEVGKRNLVMNINVNEKHIRKIKESA